MDFYYLLVIIVTLIILFTLFAFLLYYLISNNFNKKLTTINEENKLKNEELLSVKKEYESKIEKLNLELNNVSILKEKLNQNYKNKIYELLNIPKNELYRKIKNELSYEILSSNKKELYKYANDLQLEKVNISNEILLKTINQLKTSVVNDNSLISIYLEDDSFKGKIIGKSGRNFNLLENKLEVEIVIDSTPNYIYISSYDPIRREIAKRVIEALIRLNTVNHLVIDEQYEKQINDLDNIAIEKGKEAFYKFDLYNEDINLIKHLGMLYFYSSFSQNLLSHSVEVALICKLLSSELNLDENIAIRCGLLHDIGKYNPTNILGSHVELGVKFAKYFKEDEIIINAINEHHDTTISTSHYSEIVKIADSISASRPGVRIRDYNEYFKRISELEQLTNKIKGVKNAFAIQGGRELRVIVESDEVSDYDIPVLSNIITLTLNNNYEYSGIIKLTIIRENTYKTEINIGA